MTLELHTERMRLRPFDASDFAFDQAMATNAEVMRFFGGAASPEDAADAVTNYACRGAGGRIGVWTALDRATEERLGELFLTPLPIDAEDTDWAALDGEVFPDGDIEIGFFFRKDLWGRGLATEACRRLLRFAFDETPLREIVAVVDADNLASQNVLLKCGFVSDGPRRAYGAAYPGYRLTRERFFQHNP